jgi:phage terminase small subunit
MSDNLTPKQRKAIETLMTTGDVSEACKDAGISRETIYRWFKQDTFKDAIDQATSEAIESLSRSLVLLGDQATQTLRNAMSDQDTPIATRVRAADVVLGRLLQLRELYTLEARVTELERIIK